MVIAKLKTLTKNKYCLEEVDKVHVCHYLNWKLMTGMGLRELTELRHVIVGCCPSVAFRVKVAKVRMKPHTSVLIIKIVLKSKLSPIYGDLWHHLP